MLCPTAPALPWVAWATLPHLRRYYAPLRLPPCPSRVASRVARFPIPCLLPSCVVSLTGSWPGGSSRSRQGLWSPGPPIPGLWSRRPMALPRSRVPLLKTCPALRPRWCPRYSPKRIQDCCLPVRAHRRLTTTLPIAGLNHAAYLLATPGSVRPLTGRHAGSLLTGWLDVSQMGLEPRGSHPLGNNNQFHGFSPTPKVSGFPWREHALVRRGMVRTSQPFLPH